MGMKMDHLPTCMHPHRLTGDASDCRLQCTLDGWPMRLRLALKAMKVSAIILNTACNLHTPCSVSGYPLVHSTMTRTHAPDANYTRAICAISAASPLRRPSFVIRV